jgi:glycosyltransferase involved in cell wall biosynthesis
MRIGVDLSVIQSTKSGVDWYTHHVIKGMMGLLAPDEEMVLFSNRETGFEKEAAAYPRASVVMSSFRYQEPWRQFVLPLLLRKHQIDVCFFTNFVLSVAAHCPMVLTIHDLSFKLFPRTHSLRNVIWARSLVPISTRRARRIIAVSNNTKLDLLRVMNVKEEKIDVVFEAASGDYSPEPQPDDGEALSMYGISQPYILYVGTLEPRKNLTMLIRAFDKAAKALPDLHLVLAGRRGWMAQSIFDEFEKRNLLGRVHITGYVQDEHLPALYRQAAAFVYPSLYEGFGLPPLEAMSSGTPVIVSHSSSLPEVVGDAGLYVNPLDTEELAEAIEAVAGDSQLSQSLREKGLQRAPQFSWKKTAEETLEIIREAARV